MKVTVIKRILFLILVYSYSFSQSKYGTCYDLTTSPNPTTGFGESGLCEHDIYGNTISIPQEMLDNTARSFVTISSLNCTGTVIAKYNNDTQNPDYYLLTARHCIHDDIIENGPSMHAGLSQLKDLTQSVITFNGSRASASSPKPCEVNHQISTPLSLIDESLENDMRFLR